MLTGLACRLRKQQRTAEALGAIAIGVHKLVGQYRNIQEREGIITSLLPEDQAAREANQRTDTLVRNRKVLVAFRRELRKAGLSPQTVEGHVATIADFASTTLVEADPPRGVLELTVADIESYVRGKPAKQLLTSFKRFVRFLVGTGRIEEELLYRSVLSEKKAK